MLWHAKFARFGHQANGVFSHIILSYHEGVLVQFSVVKSGHESCVNVGRIYRAIDRRDQAEVARDRRCCCCIGVRRRGQLRKQVCPCHSCHAEGSGRGRGRRRLEGRIEKGRGRGRNSSLKVNS